LGGNNAAENDVGKPVMGREESEGKREEEEE
jgi:hypothetical protein